MASPYTCGVGVGRVGGVKDSLLICDRRGQSCSVIQPGHLSVCPFFSPSTAPVGGGQVGYL